MTETLPAELKFIDDMCQFFDRLVKVEEERGNLVITIDNGKGEDLFKFKAVRYGGQWNLHHMKDKALTKVQLFDIIHDGITTSIKRK